MRYQKIESKIWNDEKFSKLTPLQQRLFFYVLTSPHGNLLGLYVLKEGYVCEDLKCSAKDFRKDFQKLIEIGLLNYDPSVCLVFIKNFLKHNPITNPNQVKAAEKIIQELPKSSLILMIKGLVKGLNEALLEGLNKVVSKPEEEEETEAVTEEDSVSFCPENNGTDEFRLSNLLLEKIKERKPNFKDPKIDQWAKHVGLMISADKRDPNRIQEIIEWCQDDPFWQNNILSTEKLRKQFDQLELKMEKSDANPYGVH